MEKCEYRTRKGNVSKLMNMHIKKDEGDCGGHYTLRKMKVTEGVKLPKLGVQNTPFRIFLVIKLKKYCEIT